MPPTDPQDEVLELVERARRGDRTAWDGLYALYEGDLRQRVRSRLAGGRGIEPDEPSDVEQSVWGEVLGSLGNFEYRGEGSFLAWVSAIVRNKIARKASRSAQRVPTIGGAEALGVLAAEREDFPGPPTEVRSREELRLLRRAMTALKEGEQEVLHLSWFEGLKHREVGARLGLSEDAARMRVTRAVARLACAFRRLQGAESA